jgi:ABC-type molybdate transport system substrate-binding protein
MSYPIATVKGSAEKKTAQAFEDYVLGPRRQAVLRKDGFLAP